MKKLNRAFFLDRDGVINLKPAEHDYVKSWEEFQMLPEVPSAISLIKKAGFKVIVITNQQGIALGLLNLSTLHQIHNQLNKLLMEHGTFIDGFYICPHHKKDHCFCRKPKPGLLLKAAKDFQIDLSSSYLIGDSENDQLAGQQLGVQSFLVPSNCSLLKIVQQILHSKARSSFDL